MAEDILDYLQGGGDGIVEATLGETFNYDPGVSGNVDYYPSMLNCPAVTLSHEAADHLPPYIVARYIERFE